MTLALGGKSYAVCLNPILDGFPLPVSSWKREGESLLGELPDVRFRVKLTAGESQIEYTLDGTSSFHGEIRYFAGTEWTDSVVRGFLPDHYNRVFQSGESAEFSFGAAAKESQFDRGLERIWMTCPAPKTLAFRDKWADEGPWWGVIVPDPLPTYETIAGFRQGRFDLAFTHFCGVAYNGRFPKVQFHFGLDSETAVLDRYVDYYRENGYLRERGQGFEWWSRPIFCTWGQQEYLEGSCDFEANPMTESSLADWVDRLEEKTGGHPFTLIVDSHWFDHYGEYGVHPGRFGNVARFRGLIDSFKERGHKVVLWYTPLWVSKTSRLVREHPEYLVKDLDGNLGRVTNTEIYDFVYLLDCSRRDVREHIRGTVRYLLSEEEGCLNADGFKIDMNYYGPVGGKHAIDNYDWGIGEKLWYELIRFIGTEAESLKADAFLTLSGAEPYLQPWAPAQRLNDLFPVVPESPDPWYRRAALVNKMLPGVLIDVDGWPSARTRSAEYWMVSPTFGVPVTYHLDGFDTKEKFGEADFARMRAAWNVYSNAPITTDMAVHIDPDRRTFYRKYRSGPLAGFFSAIALHNSCLLTYSENLLMAASIADMVVEAPLPPGRTVASAYKRMSGINVLLDWEENGEAGTVRFRVEDCGKGIEAIVLELAEAERGV
ncbi:alpha-galactosidase [Cohnella fermenti]|uniref:Uncharacterized protein n=1 Tax=Cohnella fermenti TaxID=2565925 RepID=A0A4S4BPA4_9BACL|nr:alpha-galactosidase [Cohnella fermenti]THF76739.1 hypothetical protein E6C55_18405 [Cohnella fermenti]